MVRALSPLIRNPTAQNTGLGFGESGLPRNDE
jgi:hypothetical protein